MNNSQNTKRKKRKVSILDEFDKIKYHKDCATDKSNEW